MAQQRAPFRTTTTADVAATFPGRWSLGQKDRWDAEDAELFMDRMTVTGTHTKVVYFLEFPRRI